MRKRGFGLKPHSDVHNYQILRDPLDPTRRVPDPELDSDPEPVIADRSEAAKREVLQNRLRLLRESLRRRYRLSLLEFCRDVLGYPDLDPEVHGDICHMLEEEYWGLGRHPAGQTISRKLGVLAPRLSFKSTITSIAYPIWILIQDDPHPVGHYLNPVDPWSPPPSFNGRKGYDQRILLASETEDNPIGWAATIRNHLEKNQKLRDLFGDLAPERRGSMLWTKWQFNIAWRQDLSRKEANLTVGSLMGAIVGSHYDIAICDDIVTENTVATDDAIQGTIDWHKGMLPVLEHNSLHLYVGTRWHHYDLYGYLMEEERGGWLWYIESAERTEDEIAAGKARYWFPRKLGPERLRQLRDDLGPYKYSCLYLNSPARGGDAAFKEEYFTDAFFDLPAGQELLAFLSDKTICTTIDPAISKDKRACYRVVTTWAWDHRGHGYCLDLYYDRQSAPAEWLREAYRQFSAWNPIYSGLEQIDTYRFTTDVLSQELGLYPNWVELSPGGRRKDPRIHALIPFASTGKLHLQRHHRALVDEAIRWPTGRYRDALDCTAYQLDLVFTGRAPDAAIPEPGTPEFDQANRKAEYQERLVRLKVADYDDAERYDWYHM